MTMSKYHYKAFGLVFSSTTEIPSLESALADPSAPVDVEIVEERVYVPNETVAIDEMRVAVRDGDLYLRMEESGSFRVSGGNRISIEPEPGVPFDQVTIYLLGSVFGALLHQRGLLPIHCNAIEHDGRAFLFCGDSGAGKSTLAAYFKDRGFRLLTDDVCALRLEPDALVALPGIARLKLWRESLELLGRSPEGLRQLPWKVEKYEVPVLADALADPLPVGGIYHLRDAADGREHGIHRLSGLTAANTVMANIFRRRVADLMGLTSLYLEKAMRITVEVPIFSVNRTWGLDHFRTEADAAEQHMRDLAKNSNA